MEDDGVLINYGIANMGVDPMDLEKLYDEEVEKVKNELISEQEFQKLQNQIENQILSSNAFIHPINEIPLIPPVENAILLNFFMCVLFICFLYVMLNNY